MTYVPNPDFKDDLRKELADDVSRAAIILQHDLKGVLSKSPSPSAPGQPPGVDTGMLRRSVQADLSTVQANLTARVGTNQAYGRYLEYGTRHMAARPWLRPTARRFRDKLARLLGGGA